MPEFCVRVKLLSSNTFQKFTFLKLIIIMVGQQKKIRDTSSSMDAVATDGGISMTKPNSNSPKSRLAKLKRSTIKRNGGKHFSKIFF